MGQESLREARRQNQRRYRKKQHDNMCSLEQETSKLELEIKQLEKRRCVLSAVVPGDGSAWSVVAEYFRLFEYGLREQPTTQQQQSPVANTKEVANPQLTFLRSRLAPNVLLNEGRGVDVAIYCWRRVSFWFQDFRVELEDLHREGAHSLLAATRTSFTITERTLRNVFPGIWNERESDTGSVLVGKLLSRRIVMRGITRFEWDPRRCFVTTVFAQSDLLTPVLDVLGNLKDVERVFGKAVISPDFRWTASS
ncbi:uncharacterized protein IUM83_09991 [Phytophthora cinnamomi]|uniref:uncharacterized protein n=1 Tax=Phytophthora cinnamomi TaxID=4785 RepID=UPI003559B0D6|nr:hypothetical protein IUM83_09991 [Phytophthora cinnamomi]